jgi:putative transposase
VKYGQIDTLRQQFPIAVMCRVLDVSESGYHAWRKRPLSPRAVENARLETEIKAAHQRTRETYGPERLQADLADNGIQVGVHRIKRLRRKLGLRCKQKRKFIATTDSAHTLPIAPNLLNRQFTATAPNKAWQRQWRAIQRKTSRRGRSSTANPCRRRWRRCRSRTSPPC